MLGLAVTRRAKLRVVDQVAATGNAGVRTAGDDHGKDTNRTCEQREQPARGRVNCCANAATARLVDFHVVKGKGFALDYHLGDQLEAGLALGFDDLVDPCCPAGRARSKAKSTIE
jgi:hypothetical protein